MSTRSLFHMCNQSAESWNCLKTTLPSPSVMYSKSSKLQILPQFLRNNIYAVYVPANCTNRLKPLDISVNKVAKEFMRTKFCEWYVEEVQKLLDQGANEVALVDLKMSMMKPLGAHWLASLHDYITTNNSIVLNGFKYIANFVHS